MGNWKDVKVKDQAAIADTDTSKGFDLPKALISAIHVRINGTGGSSAALAYTMVTKARIDTDGKDKKPLDLSSAQLVRREGILFGIPPAVTNANGAYSEIPFAYYAGVKARDKRLMLDLRKCNKRKLNLTFDAVLFNATSRFTSGTIKITIIATCWIGVAPPEFRGHIRQEEALSFATGTGDKQTYDLPIHKGGMLAFIDITVSAVTTVENVELTANSDSIQLINEHIRDLIHRMNYERHLDTALTLTAYFDFMFVDRYETQLTSLPSCDKINSTKLIVERGATTTTVVIVLGTILS